MTVYDEVMVPRMFGPWAEVLLDQLAPARGSSLLDVACGPGTVARAAARRLGPRGRVTACDLSPAMLAVAASKVVDESSAPIEYRECAADALDVRDETFDLATCQQGLQFFPQRNAALLEIRRALRPGAKLGVAVWRAIEECPPFAALGVALAEVLGEDVAATFRGGPWGLTNGAELTRLLEDAGFVGVSCTSRRLPIVFEGGPTQLLQTLGATTVASAMAALDESQRRALLAAVTSAAAAMTDDDGAVRSETSAHLVIGTK